MSEIAADLYFKKSPLCSSNSCLANIKMQRTIGVVLNPA